MGPSFEIDGFFEKVLNPGDEVSVFKVFWPPLHNVCKDPPNFL